MSFELIPITDVLGALLAFATTILYVKNNVWSWPLCILANLTNMYLFLKTGIYGEASLELLYISIAIYGLYNWKFGGTQHKPAKISNLPHTEGLILLMACIIIYLVANYILSNHTDSTIPQLDAFTMSLCIIGQWMVARRYIENWAVWFVADSLLAYMFYYKNLPVHMWLNIVYLPIVFYGYYNWSKQKKQHGLTCREQQAHDHCYRWI